MIIIGIDPGQSSGGIAVVDGQGFANAEAIGKMTERDIWEFIQQHGADKAYIEQVGAFPGQGRSSIFKFGQNYGLLRGLLIAAGIPFETVTAGVWQKNMRCLSKGDKNVTKARAQELYPELRITHSTADALLIATYGRRKEQGGV
jgi:Holliday junction resolvasome RuvABC endonuclease subunit